MNSFIHHYHGPKSSVRNTAEETVALENILSISNFSKTSHPVSWNVEKGQHRLNISAERQFPALLIWPQPETP